MGQLAVKAQVRKSDTIKLDIAAWTQAALALLEEQGIDGVRVELLAKRLNVTKGSFYWHFRDRDALHLAMLEAWRKRATVALIERLERGETTPEARFRRLIRLPLLGRRSEKAANVELAVRLWGRRDPRARAALADVDQLRLNYIAQLLMAIGQDTQQARATAILAYSYMRVAATLLPPDAHDLIATCEDLLIRKVA